MQCYAVSLNGRCLGTSPSGRRCTATTASSCTTPRYRVNLTPHKRTTSGLIALLHLLGWLTVLQVADGHINYVLGRAEEHYRLLERVHMQMRQLPQIVEQMRKSHELLGTRRPRRAVAYGGPHRLTQTGLAILVGPPAGDIHKRIEQIEGMWDEFEAQEAREDFERWSFSQLSELENVMATKRYGRSHGPYDGVALPAHFAQRRSTALSAEIHRRDLKAKEFSLRRQKAEAERQADEERMRRVQAAAAAEKAEAERTAGGRQRTTSRTSIVHWTPS